MQMMIQGRQVATEEELELLSQQLIVYMESDQSSLSSSIIMNVARQQVRSEFDIVI